MTRTVAPEPFEALAPEWEALARRLPSPIPFHFPDWHRAWWRHFGDGRTPVYLAVREDGRLAAVLPLMRDGETLAIAGDPNVCDYTSVPIADGADPDLLRCLLAAVDTLPWRTFHLWGLPEQAPALAATCAWAGERGYAAETDFEAVCPRVTLGGDWERYLGTLSKKDRHELRRKLRRFEQVGTDVRLRVLRAPGEVEAALPAFFHLQRISHRGKEAFMTPRMEAFFREMAVGLAAYGHACVYQIDVEGRPAASLLTFLSGDELLFYNSGYDPEYAHASVGLVSKVMAMQRCVEDGLTVADFLRGAEPYKYDLGGQDRIVRQMVVSRMKDEEGRG
jgi:CelD/BcsL family acetyltransferase involved in cellulose biosynthesis